jgi:hypothetical protein
LTSRIITPDRDSALEGEAFREQSGTHATAALR